MTTDDIGRLAYLSLILLAVSIWFFMANRNRLSQSLQQMAIWALIFLGVITAYGFRDIIREQLTPKSTFVLSQNSVVLRRAADGHFQARLEVNGVPVDFIVDTGASEIVLTKRDAERVGLNPERLNYFGRAGTANGTVRTADVRLEVVKLGEITDYSLPASVNDGDLFGSLLGMSYLNLFSEVRISGDEMFLTR
jgi:aspartyl protease family protein